MAADLERAGLRLDVAATGLPAVIQGSWDHLSEVMQNLLDNARKFSPQGGTVCIRVDASGADAIVSVSDQGIGVSAEKLPQLFERFYQADAGVTRRFGGMGLGLALVREIVIAHRGRVWAESPGEGAGFTVSFAIPVVT
ncbi:MAG: ATP-binding protein [Caldilineales bacterium]